MSRRGFTILELLTALALAGILVLSLSAAFSVAVDTSRRFGEPRQALENRVRFEDRVRRLLMLAYVSETATDLSTYFIGRTVSQSTGLNNAGGADEVVFTRLGEQPAGPFLNTNETDFEALNTSYGPQGGPLEVAITLTPIGEAGNRTGLFLRTQSPSDGDPDQGGFEEILDDQIAGLSFEFYDGEAWTTEWDTRTSQDRALPSAVRVSYRLTEDDEETTRVFVVNLRNARPVDEAGGTF